MEKQPEFKKNLWGYDKEAVLKYIDEMSRTAAQSEAALQEKVSQIAHSREELEGQIAEFEQKLQHISGVLDTEKGKNKSLSEMIGLLQEEIDRQRRYSQARDRDFQAMQEKNRELAGQMKIAADKSKKYDEAAASIGSAILEAQHTARSIIDTANGRAQEISKDTDQFISAVLEKMDSMQQEFAFLRGKMNESINMLNSRFDQIESDLSHAREAVYQKSLQLQQRAEKYDSPLGK